MASVSTTCCLTSSEGSLCAPSRPTTSFSHVDYGRLAANGLTGGLGEIKAYRLSAGVVLRFGGSLPKERPLVYACSASPSQVFAGDPVTVNGSSTGPASRNRSIYSWEVSGGRVAINNDTAVITTSGLAPGNYVISGHLSQGKRAEENATCAESFTVMAPVPPTISCSANPVSVRPGGHSTITSVAKSLQNRPLAYSFSASGGQIASSIAIATLNTGDAKPGPITVDCRVSDDLGQVTKANTVVNVSAPPAPVAARRTLCGLSFERDRKRPVRVDNEAKACLDDVALSLNREADARLKITGESAPDESASMATARASNARIYLTQEKGIDPSRIDVKTGTIAGRTAEIELIPVGTPIHYSDNQSPAAPMPIIKQRGLPPAADQILPAAAPEPSYQGTGAIGPRRSADSLILPPLPADATDSKGLRQRRRTAKHRRRRKSMTAAARTSGTANPTPANGGSNA